MAYDTRPPLDTRTQVTYGLGTLAYGVKNQAMGSMLLLYFNQVVGLPAAWVGAAIAISLVVDAVLDPLIGYASDHLRSPWGRRHPFMYAAALPAAVAFHLLFNPPGGWSEPALFGYMLASMLALRVLISFYEVPSAATGAELTLDYDQRTAVMSYRFFFGALGSALIAVLTFSVFLEPSDEFAVGQLNPEGYADFASFGAVLIAFSILISTWGTHHFIPCFHKPEPQPFRPRAMLGEIVETLWTRNFGVLLLWGSLSAIVVGLTGGLGMYFNTYFWELTADQIGFIVSAGFVAPFLAIALAPRVGARLGKKWAVVALWMVGAVIAILPISLKLLGLLPPNGSPVVLGLLFADALLVGTLSLSGLILGASMVADLAEETAVKTGRRSEGVLFSADAIIKQTIVGVGTFLSGLMLTWVEFPQHAVPGEIDPAIMVELAWLYLPVSVALTFASIGVLGLYSNDRQRHEAHLAVLRARAAANGTDRAPEA
ncbi:MAG TPA: MFS transporter [Pseudomonadales bacterium]